MVCQVFVTVLAVLFVCLLSSPLPLRQNACGLMQALWAFCVGLSCGGLGVL